MDWKCTVFAALAALTLAPVTTNASETAITCINPTSGTTWQIRVDFENGTVDRYPARISATEISWHDASDGGNYTLDRGSGKLTVIVASSTGGYFLYDSCRMPN